MPAGPRDAVFTTVLFQPGRGVADLALHLARLEHHATALRLSPELDEAQDAIASACHGIAEEGLVRLTWSNDGWTGTFRKRHAFTDVDAITVPAPRWAGRITGTKHGAWSWASEAAAQGEAMGADAVLLVHEHRIVDERRKRTATPSPSEKSPSARQLSSFAYSNDANEGKCCETTKFRWVAAMATCSPRRT